MRLKNYLKTFANAAVDLVLKSTQDLKWVELIVRNVRKSVILLACIDGGACIIAAVTISAGVSALLIKLGLRKPKCDPHCKEKL